MGFKLGLIGAGGIGQNHLLSIANIGMQATYVADVNGEQAAKVAKEKGVANHSGNPSELLASPEVDAVIIGVPNKFHASLAIEALNAGKHVLLEKPMAMNVAECDQIIEAAQKAGKILQMGFVQRYSAVGATAKQFIDAGRLGEIYHVKANYYRRRGIPGLGGWFTTKALSGGGPLIDLGVHIMDLMLYLLGQPKPLRVSGKVYANFGKRMKGYLHENMWAGPPRFDGTCDVEDSAHALIRLEGGATFEINTTWAGNFSEKKLPNVMAILGDKGGLTFELGGDEVTLATEENGHNVDISPALREVNNFDEQIKVFVENCKTNTQPHASGQAGRAVQSIIDAIYESSEKDCEVELKY